MRSWPADCLLPPTKPTTAASDKRDYLRRTTLLSDIGSWGSESPFRKRRKLKLRRSDSAVHGTVLAQGPWSASNSRTRWVAYCTLAAVYVYVIPTLYPLTESFMFSFLRYVDQLKNTIILYMWVETFWRMCLKAHYMIHWFHGKNEIFELF